MSIMTRQLYILIAACLLLFCHIQTAEALFIREYTEDHPLTIVSDWEFPPYEFRNDRGEPDGYNVEVLDLILTKLEIPHRFVMKEWYQCTETFEKREADLIHALTFKYKQRPYVMTQNMITYYNLRVARHKKTPPLTQIGKLTEEDTLILKKNDYAALRIGEMRDRVFKTEYHSSREALTGLRSGKYKYYIWGEIPLSMKIREYGVEDVVLDEIDIPAGELRIIGYDKELIDAIDDNFARMEQSGEMERIRDKWFHPDKVHNDTSPITLIILVGVVIAGIIAFLFSQLIRNRVKMAINKSTDLNHMMTQALNMGAYAVVEYDIDNQHLRNLHGHVVPDEGMPSSEFLSGMRPEQGKVLHENNLRLIKGDIQTFEMTVSLNSGTAEQPQWKDYYGYALVEKENGRPKYIIYTVKDLTEELIEEQLNLETGIKFHKMFETSLIAMSFFNKEGMMIDANQKMRQLCNFNEDTERYFRNMSLFNTPSLEGQIEPTRKDVFHVCQRMFYPDLGIYRYIELKIRPTFDEEGDLRFYIATARDLSAERKMYLDQRNHEQEMNKANEKIQAYEEQLRYLLDNSKMTVWRSDLRTGEVFFSHSLKTTDYKETIEDYTNRIDESEQQSSRNAIADPDFMSKPFNVIHHFKHAHDGSGPGWHAISGIPTYDSKGERIGYFGISRNITNLMDAQQKLKEETKRAENSGKMKSAFLANMTHEIRTPLNAIVGFSDLLPMVDTKQERMDFIRIIRNNCDMLMRLINDILEASNMGQALAIKPTSCDLAVVFNDICQTLAQRVEEPGVEFIKDNPYDTFPVVLDIGRIQQVLTNFTTNAVKYTHQGHIKVGYREQDNGVYFYCEDTGAGIPKEKQASVFERFVKLNDFVQGTGLGLSICQAIAERCGGKIGVTSEGEGHGSTFWLWTPREITPSKTES